MSTIARPALAPSRIERSIARLKRKLIRLLEPICNQANKTCDASKGWMPPAGQPLASSASCTSWKLPTCCAPSLHKNHCDECPRQDGQSNRKNSGMSFGNCYAGNKNRPSNKKGRHHDKHDY